MDNTPLNVPEHPNNPMLQAEINNLNPNVQNISPKNNKKILVLISLVILIFLVVTALIILLGHHANKTINISTDANACINKTYQEGSSGPCVSYLQTMLNFLETDNLNECVFKGSSTLNVNGNFDANTKDQILVIQNWLNCYNKQEGAPVNIDVNGIVSTSTWADVCTYAYVYPKQAGQSSSPFFKASLIAGKNAGC